MSTVDVLIYVHPELSAEDRTRVEREVMACVGVISTSFDHPKLPHALMVQYNPDAVQAKQILAAVRQHDPAATLVAL